MYVGCAVLLIIMIHEMNAYTQRETVKGIFLTLFAMLVGVAVIFILYVLGRQVWNFMSEVVNEVIYRVRH